MYESYYDSAEGMVITRARAIRELVRHGYDENSNWDEFFIDMGDRVTYDAQAVLRWLGY
jgi:hypothetical protein